MTTAPPGNESLLYLRELKTHFPEASLLFIYVFMFYQDDNK